MYLDVKRMTRGVEVFVWSMEQLKKSFGAFIQWDDQKCDMFNLQKGWWKLLKTMLQSSVYDKKYDLSVMKIRKGYWKSYHGFALTAIRLP